MIEVPFHSSCVALQYKTKTKLFHRAIPELHGIKNRSHPLSLYILTLAFLNYHAPVDGDPLVLSLIYDMHVEDIHYAHKGWGIISFNRCITDWLVNYSKSKCRDV